MAQKKRSPKRGMFDLRAGVEETPTEQENSFADRFNGKRIPRSGAYRPTSRQAMGSGYGGDVVLKNFLFEMKLTTKNSISLKKEWLRKIAVGARPKGKNPGLHIQFNGIDSTCDDRWVLIEESVFKELIEGQLDETEKGSSS